MTMTEDLAGRPVIPAGLVATAERYGQEEWLAGLPDLIVELARRWGLELGRPFSARAGGSWVAPAGIVDGVPTVFKVGMPSRESRTEASGLRFFDGRGAVRVIRSDGDAFALLMERCEPGDDLWTLDVPTGNRVAADVLGSLWRPAGGADGIELLADLVGEWAGELPGLAGRYPGELIELAGSLGAELAGSQPGLVVLHGDFNHGNVLRGRRGWLSIDCKPLVGDPAYDLAQFLANRLGGSAEGPRDPADAVFTPSVAPADIAGQVDFFAGALGLDRDRILGWSVVKALAWDWGPATASVFAGLLDRR